MASEIQSVEKVGEDPESQRRKRTETITNKSKSLNDELWDQEESHNEDGYGENTVKGTDPSSTATAAGQAGAFGRRRGYSRKMQEENGEYEPSPLGTTRIQSNYASLVQLENDTDGSSISEDARSTSPTQQPTEEDILSRQRKAFHTEQFEKLDMELKVAQMKTEMRLISAKLAYGSRDWQDMSKQLEAAYAFSIESQSHPLQGRVQFYYAICRLRQEEFDDAITRFSFAKSLMQDVYDESTLIEQWVEETKAAKSKHQRNKYTGSPEEQLQSLDLDENS